MSADRSLRNLTPVTTKKAYYNYCFFCSFVVKKVGKKGIKKTPFRCPVSKIQKRYCVYFLFDR